MVNPPVVDIYLADSGSYAHFVFGSSERIPNFISHFKSVFPQVLLGLIDGVVHLKTKSSQIKTVFEEVGRYFKAYKATVFFGNTWWDLAAVT